MNRQIESDDQIRERLGLADRDLEELLNIRDTWVLDTFELEAVSAEIDSLDD